MNRAARKASSVVLTALVVLLATGPGSSSHAPDGDATTPRYFRAPRWAVPHTEDYFFGGDVPDVDRVRNAIINGEFQWTRRAETLNFRAAGRNPGVTFPGRLTCVGGLGAGVSFIFQAPLPADRSAETILCVDGANRPVSFQLTFNRDVLWHSQTTADPVLAGAVDRWAIASHEFGHATAGWLPPLVTAGHWPDTSSRCNGTNSAQYLTMCGNRLPPDQRDFRDLGDHDAHTFDLAY